MAADALGVVRRDAAERVDGGARRVFTALAKMEDQHEHKFAAMRKKMSQTQEYLAEFDPDNGAGLYLQFSVESDIFGNPPEDVLSGKESASQLIRFALEREKDSIIFFKSMKDAVSTDEDKQRVEKIINEEISHTLKLTKLLVDHQ